MDSTTEQQHYNEQLIWVKEAPKFKDILQANNPRINPIHSTQLGEETGWKKMKREFTEKEGLKNLSTFINQTIDTANKVGNKQVEEEATTFKDNLVFIGESELHEATVGLAQHIKDVIQNGEHLYVYISGNRSERYIAMRIMEEFDNLTEENPNLRQKVKISDNDTEIVKDCLKTNGKVIVPDDFAISGTRIRDSVGRISGEFVKNGLSPEESKAKTEALLIASSKRQGSDSISHGNFQSYSYFLSSSNNFWEGGITGSHCSTDYGFEDRTKTFREFLQTNGIQTAPPLLTNIERPYSNESTSAYFVGYTDPDLQQRWEKIERKYSLTPKSKALPASSPQ